jgi:hypothetical protein
MSDIKRYDIDQTCDFCSMSVSEAGDYVEAEDYFAMQAKLQTMASSLEDLSEANCTQKNAWIAARLTTNF